MLPNLLAWTLAQSTPSTWILVLNIIPSENEPGLLGKVTDSRIGAGYMQVESETSCTTEK